MPPEDSPASPNPTMEDVARAAGVHQTTVSRALRNDPRITETVREHVREAAARLGYRTNPLLAALGTLRRQRATTPYQTPLAYVVRGNMRTPHWEGARQAAARRGFQMEQFVLDDDLGEDRLNVILETRNIQGLLIGPLPEAHGHFVLDWSRFSTVVIEYSFTEPAFDRVVTDSFSAMNMAIAECRRRGYSRLGLVLAQVVDERNEGLLSAAYALARERDAALADILPLVTGSWDEKAFLRWFAGARPQVIISSNTLLPQIFSCLHARGRRVPRDIGLLNLNAKTDGAYSGICQDAPAIGAAAARLLIEKLNHNERGVPASRSTLLTDGWWFEGKTLLPLPGADAVRRKPARRKASERPRSG